MSYVFWLSLGLILAVSEFVVPGFVIIFFGFGAIITGIVKLFAGGMPDSIALLVFALSSLLSLVLFRKTWAGGRVVLNDDTAESGSADCVGRTVSVVEAIAPGKVGKVELNGTNWDAESEESITPGTRAVITARRGLTLIVKGL